MIHLAFLVLTTSNTYDVTLKGYVVGAVMEVSYIVLWLRFYYVSYYANGGKKYVEHKKGTKEH